MPTGTHPRRPSPIWPLYGEHRSRLLAVLERRIDHRLRQRIEPEEVLQDTFLTASRRWPAYQAAAPVHLLSGEPIGQQKRQSH
jgi:hypothetical protein